MARVRGLIYEKNYQLKEDDPARKFKGRGVLLGDQVKDQNMEVSHALSRPWQFSGYLRCIEVGRFLWLFTRERCPNGRCYPSLHPGETIRHSMLGRTTGIRFST